MVGFPTSNGFSAKYADSFGVPREISLPILNLTDRWIEKSGHEWTISRLKSIKTDFIRLKAGLPALTPWVKTGRKSTFGGPIGGLERWCSRSWKRWSKAILFLNNYTRYYSPIVTPSQERKFLDGVNSTPIKVPTFLRNMIKRSVHEAGIKPKVCGKPHPLLTRPTSSSKSEPHAGGKSYPEGEQTIECYGSYIYRTRLGAELRYGRYPDLFNPVQTGFLFWTTSHGDVSDKYIYPDHVGKIGLIQEAGYKLRAVANPARAYQQVLKPLGDQIYGILPSLPWDCTHNQSRADHAIRDNLLRQRETFCVDLSGATDYFPLSLQMDVLGQIFPEKDYLRLFEDLSKAPWRYKDSFISWKRGQPLGLFPSFGAFALTHGLLLFTLNANRHNNDFFILGDDVVIFKKELYQSYRNILKILDCPVSEPKTIVSSKVAEFGGKIFLRETSFHQLKWRNPSDDSFLDVVRNIGPAALSLLKPRQRRIAKLLYEVPDFMGGLGFNPKGKPLSQRYYESIKLLERDKNTSYLMSFNRKIQSCFYTNRD